MSITLKSNADGTSADIQINGVTQAVIDNTGRITAAKFAGNGSELTGVTGIANGVESFNTRTGTVTLTSGDVTTALGFTPATSGSFVQIDSYGTIGGFRLFGGLTGSVVNPGTYYSGSTIDPYGMPSGTYRCFGTTSLDDITGYTALYQRVA